MSTPERICRSYAPENGARDSGTSSGLSKYHLALVVYVVGYSELGNSEYGGRFLSSHEADATQQFRL